MKKVFLSIILLTQIIFADSINWSSYNELITKFKTNKLTIEKPILLFVGATTCGYCKKQLDIFNSSDKLSSFINKNYYPVIVFQDKEKDLLDRYKTDITPTLIILNPADLTQMTPDNTKGIHSDTEIYYYLKSVFKGYQAYLKSIKQ
jgi:thioredoxin-related protein